MAVPREFKVRDSEFRLAIHQVHDCEAEEIRSVVPISIARAGEPDWKGDVRVFALSGHRDAKLCYSWPEFISETEIVIHAVLHSERIATAEMAVKSVLRSRRRNKRI